jgi:NADPH2:quinone reductase
MTTMKAVRIHEHGGPEVLRHEDVAVPEPAAGEALVRVEAAGLNYIDVYHRTGLYKIAALPATLGVEAAGVVVSVGPGVSGLRIGERVAFAGPAGAYAEQVAVPADRLVGLPEGVSSRQAAAVLLQGLTAHYLTRTTYALQAGDACLVHAAAGGVGLLLCQIARSLGARVIGTVSSAQKAQLAREAGASEVILYTETDFAAEVQRLTDRRGVQVVYDGVGRATFDLSLTCLAPRGMMVLFGQASGTVPPFDPALLAQRGSLFLTRPNLFHYVATRGELEQRAAELFDWLSAGRIKPRIDQELPLAQAAEAHRALEARRTSGKLLLIP